MEDAAMNWEQKTLITELTQGMELAKQLRTHLTMASPSSFETNDLLIQKILSSFDKSLLVLRWGSTISSMGMGQHQQPHAVSVLTGLPESPLSINGSPKSEDFDKDSQESGNVSKKRKTLPRWTNQVQVSSENGFEGPHDDGFSWRKYGQKDILGAKYPRSYYRCTFRNTQNCWATKQVQRSDENPTIFEISYRGNHICFNGNQQQVPQPASPEKQQEQKIPCNHNLTNNQQRQSQQLLLSFQKELRVNTKELEHTETEFPFSFPSTFRGIENVSPAIDNSNSVGNLSPSYISPATPEANYFTLPSCSMINFDAKHNPYDSTEIISSNSSNVNSPGFDLVFCLDQIENDDTNFPFDTSAFFA